MSRPHLKEKKITIATHVFLTGPGDELVKYLTNLSVDTLYIGHPFNYADRVYSFYVHHQKSGGLREGGSALGKFPEVLNYIKDFLTTIFFSLRFGKRDIFIGINNLNAVAGIVLRSFGLADRVVFYTIDYVPKRFEKPILNKIYHAIDRFAVRHSDSVWNLSGRMIEEREKSGLDKKYRHKQMTVPIGTEPFAHTKTLEKRSRYDIVYMGHLRKGQGLKNALEAFSGVLEAIPEARFQIYGTGPLEDELKELARERGIAESVVFHGAIESHTELLNRISKHTIAVAPYENGSDSFTRFTDPGKVKVYLATALPMVLTDVPEVCRDMVERKCAVMAEDNVESLKMCMVEMLNDEKSLKESIGACLKVAGEYAWDKVYSRAFETFDVQFKK